jgi:hypothetical protein
MIISHISHEAHLVSNSDHDTFQISEKRSFRRGLAEVKNEERDMVQASHAIKAQKEDFQLFMCQDPGHVWKGVFGESFWIRK